MNLKIIELLCVSFHLIGTFWQGRKPSPDTDVISLIESVQDTMPTLFQQICGSDVRLHSPQQYCDKGTQEPTVTQGGFVFI